jgi:hypothetical protein
MTYAAVSDLAALSEAISFRFDFGCGIKKIILLDESRFL